MVVDDTFVTRNILKDILCQGGHEVVAEATNGEDAISKYETYQPDLVTMDITMPIMDGIEATRRIVNDYPDAKIVMISALGTEKVVYQAIKSGARNYIVKPFDKESTLVTVRSVLEQ